MCEGKKEKGENMQLNEQQMASVSKAGKHYAAAYMLMTLAIDHIDEGDMMLTRIGKMKQRIKQGARRTQQAYDDFCREFKPLLEDAPDGVILGEFEELKEKINRIINL